ncbi:MAG TPA: LysR substrate-binding domain-containing protein [Anaeromyxobacter sp.]|nr:LysR substrate-binding domain-containing protein [Anaeromyxobacter sp.]
MLRFARTAEGMERTVAGRLRVACPPDVAEVVVAPLLRGLRRRHPALRVELDPARRWRTSPGATRTSRSGRSARCGAISWSPG